jgi:hypothetical protein
MNNLNLLLKTFEREEIEQFKNFISSDFFNKAGYLTNYFQKLIEYHPDFEDYEKNKIKIFHELYPGREYNDATIRKINSELLKLAEDFLTIQALKKDSFLKRNLLLSELDSRKIDNLFNRRIDEAYDKVKPIGDLNQKYYNELYKLNSIEILYHSVRNRTKGFDKYYELIDNMNINFLAGKLKKYTMLISDSYFHLKYIRDKNEIERFLREIVKSSFFNIPLIKILYYVLLIYWEPGIDTFNKLKKVTSEYKSLLPIEELEWIYFSLLNFSIIQINMGNSDFIKEELEIYKNLFDFNLIVYNNQIETVLYKNIISSAVEAGDIKFAEEFKEEYKKYIFTPDKKDIVNYCEANIAYAKKNYFEALEILAKVNFSEVNQKFSLRNLSLKILYDSEMFEEALSAADSYKQNIKREKKLPQDLIKLYGNFIQAYKMLIKIKLSCDKSEAGLLLQKIKKNESTAKSWLINRCAQLV